MLEKIISELKNGKAAGLDSLTAEQIKYCHPIVKCILSKLFNLMLIFNYVPDSFGIGLTVPLPKHDSMCKLVTANDFRGITVIPVISKIFEHCLNGCFKSWLTTSDLQFGSNLELAVITLYILHVPQLIILLRIILQLMYVN